MYIYNAFHILTSTIYVDQYKSILIPGRSWCSFL